MKMPLTSITSGIGMEVVPDLYCFPIQIVNICFIGEPNSKEFVLVDAGMPDSQDMIIEEAEKRFGSGAKPTAIILTHGHFDHIGALQELLKTWDVPVYAHHLEEPYLTGQENYPPPNTEAEGLVAKLSPLFPRNSINISKNLQILPNDHTIPFLPDWKVIPTPGHTPGHISLYRERDQALIVGDAFVTVEQESLYEVLTQKQEMHGPPAYFTADWQAASSSVKTLAKLKPKTAITGHGLPMTGNTLMENLTVLAENFDETEIPDNKK
ncbi:glyoxylase-like metal-dependent hydrolase (beta-lactamase superfamily II) [Bacillus mesophilus]|uniref:MBL fold metallo-hydrolase n=1 Tax=Bacillus mesophilus TaxID=1808955 RepID=A0A6M0Q8V0_9BACI|nr:MBL fold metallo-hydrolase [Bacillus mesophilus]MBM7661023.1 glyoxylase-like metal-dependent hydrolase (beta-lactamase superfamily II) [Bacillus mesophilus]NEY71438.1 MBL fold metallo-hydrolase [Bacillus mesophilus]